MKIINHTKNKADISKLENAFKFACDQLGIKSGYNTHIGIYDEIKSTNGDLCDGLIVIGNEIEISLMIQEMGRMIKILFHEISHLWEYEKGMEFDYDENQGYDDCPSENFANDMAKTLYLKWKIKGN